MLIRASGALFLTSLPLNAQVDSWDMPPVSYSDTPAQDRLSKLAESWQKDPASLKGNSALERLRSVLAQLNVSEASQVLVFSKTSKQTALINPGNPRALYFSPDCYCGYVPGGMMEVVLQDPSLGPVFYLIDLGTPSMPARVERDTSDCLSCHGTGRTENVPGMLVRSLYPDQDGHPLHSMGSVVVTHQTPIAERWGGYYVTGSISLPHLGNVTYTEGHQPQPGQLAFETLQGKIDTSKYPRPTSDVIALMALEHQCKAHNLMTAATMNYKRAYYLGKAMDAEGDPDKGSAGRVADDAAKKIVEWLLYSGEASQGEDGVEGNVEFQEQFQSSIPRTRAGESLADFHLNGRLFKNRCSYMVYSAAFRQLPDRVKSEVIAGLQRVFEATSTKDQHPEIKLPERQRIARILRETGIFR
jgi:hypothetical protein